MAFTTHETEAAIVKELDEKPLWGDNYVRPNGTKSTNYTAVADYLAGKSKWLPAMTQEGEHNWSGLLSLLHSVEAPTANDDLVLQVVREPALKMDKDYTVWLVRYFNSQPGDARFQVMMAEFQRMGLSEETICIALVQESDWSDENVQLYAPVKECLVHYFTTVNWDTGLSPTSKYGRRHVWYPSYFKLLDETNQKLAIKYAFMSLSEKDGMALMPFFLKYKEGYYIPLFIKKMEALQVKNHSESGPKLVMYFGIASALFETNKTKYGGMFETICQKYVSVKNFDAFAGIYEPSMALREPIAGRQAMACSGIALHHLLGLNKEKIIATIEEIQKAEKNLTPDILHVLHFYFGSASLGYYGKALKIAKYNDKIYAQVAALGQQNFAPAEYLPLFWGEVNSEYEENRALIAKILAEKDIDAENKALALLGGTENYAKRTACLVLRHYESAANLQAVVAVLDKEKDDNERDELLKAAADLLPQNANAQFIGAMVAAAIKRGKLKKPLKDWLDESLMPPVYYASGTALTADEVRFLLYRMARVKSMRSDMEARLLLQQMDKEKAGPFALNLIKLFIDKDTKPEFKFLMALAALIGNDQVVDKINTNITKWVDDQRYKMAVYGVDALALQGSDKALRRVEWLSRKYKSNKAVVGEAAVAALTNAAEEHGLTIYELGDKIIPDFDFQGLFKTFTAGGDEYRAFIDGNFKIAYFDENNKKLKSVPVAADKATKEEFAAIGKEVKAIAKLQSARLEYYLITQRKWDAAAWQQFFMQNPVMFIYAIKLLWGVYEGDNLVQTFVCNEDTSLQNIDGDEIEMPEGRIGMVHPTQLPDDALKKWRKYFFDNSIVPIFPQLERPAPDMAGVEGEHAIITKFEGKKTKSGAKTILEKQGWTKVRADDYGLIEAFRLRWPERKMEATIEIDDLDEKLGRLYVADLTKTDKYGYTVRGENAEFLIKPKDLPTVFLYEMLAGVEAAAV